MLSASNRRFVLGYVLLVGLPLLGLIGNLRLGQKLNAPIAVDGAWDVAAISSANGDCTESLAANRNLAFVISQSGRNLVVSSSADPLGSVDGQIEGQVVTTAPLDLSAGTNTKDRCHDAKLSITASISSAKPAVMAGELSVDGCAYCRPVRFTAVKRLPNDQTEKR